MKKVLMIIFFAILMLFSGCSGMTGSSTTKSNTPQDIDRSGTGLEVTFNVDSQYIEKQKLLYTINVKNSGVNPITLSKENFMLTTTFVDEGKDVFTQDSINEFYNKLFPNGNLELYHDQEIKSAGILVIDDNYFNDKTKTSLKYNLKVEYHYKTDFSNNLELTYKNGLFQLKTLDTVSQAAPVQITAIKLVPGIKTSEYILEYHLNDKGNNGDSTNSIQIENIGITYRGQNIIGNCKPNYKGNMAKTNSAEIGSFGLKKGDVLIVECSVNIEGEDSFTTKTEGSFEYKYTILKTGEVTIPRNN